MKTIIIATDFSNASRNASLYGVELAKALNANIILFNAYKIPQPAPGLLVCVSRYEVMAQTDKRLLDEADFLDPKRELIETICDEGSPEDAIMNIANEKKADFIITGMKGSGKNFKKIFGSTATSLARVTNIPLIIVPEHAAFTKPETIVFASDCGFHTSAQDIRQINSISKIFKSKLYVVTVLKNKNQEWFAILNSQKILNSNSGESGTADQYTTGGDIRLALNEFIENNDADILVMKPHKHEWLERLFRKSETKDMIFHTHIPLLILPDSEDKKSYSGVYENIEVAQEK